MTSILFICTANRFRSPFASAYLTRELVNRHVDGDIVVSSAGSWAENGQPAMPSVDEYARSVGLNLSHHKSRVVNEDLLAKTDLILVMTRGHKEAISIEFPKFRDRVYLLSEAAGYPPFDILDPFGDDNTTIELVAKEIIDIINQGFDSILSLAEKP